MNIHRLLPMQQITSSRTWLAAALLCSAVSTPIACIVEIEPLPGHEGTGGAPATTNSSSEDSSSSGPSEMGGFNPVSSGSGRTASSGSGHINQGKIPRKLDPERNPRRPEKSTDIANIELDKDNDELVQNRASTFTGSHDHLPHSHNTHKATKSGFGGSINQ